jgi:hypothetical protein
MARGNLVVDDVEEDPVDDLPVLNPQKGKVQAHTYQKRQTKKVQIALVTLRFSLIKVFSKHHQSHLSSQSHHPSQSVGYIIK